MGVVTPTSSSSSDWKELCADGYLDNLWASGLPAGWATQSLALHSPTRTSLIHLALEFRDSKRSAALLNWLLAHPNAGEAAGARDGCGRAALHICAAEGLDREAEQILKLPGICVNVRDYNDPISYERTPLHVAVVCDQPKVVDVLLRANANPNLLTVNADGQGDTPLMLAVQLENVGIVKQLLARPDIDLNVTSGDGPFAMTALDFAPDSGEIRDLLEAAERRQWEDGPGELEMPGEELCDGLLMKKEASTTSLASTTTCLQSCTRCAT